MLQQRRELQYFVMDIMIFIATTSSLRTTSIASTSEANNTLSIIGIMRITRTTRRREKVLSFRLLCA